MSWPFARSSRTPCDMRTIAPSSDLEARRARREATSKGAMAALYATGLRGRRGSSQKCHSCILEAPAPVGANLLNLLLVHGARTPLYARASLADLDHPMKPTVLSVLGLAVLLAACSK